MGVISQLQGVTQFYLQTDISEHTLPKPPASKAGQPVRLVLDIPTLEGWKVELN